MVLADHRDIGRMGVSLSKIRAFLRPKRSWIRFRLQTMLIVITLLAVCLGPHIHSASLQKRSVAVIHDCGGSVRYDYQYPKARYGRNDVSYSATAPVPQWLQDLFGVDFFHDVVAVRVGRKYGYGRQNPGADNGLLRCLRGFPDLRRLELTHCGITDRGLQHLPAFASLETLDLSYSSVTDDGMPYVGRLKSLRWLDLAHTRVNGRGFHRLARLEQLEALNLSYSPVRDKALRSVERTQTLRYVSVYGCRYLTRSGVAAFQKASPNCELVGLYQVKRFWQDR